MTELPARTDYGLWYDLMIDDIHSAMNEFKFTAKWAIIEMKHAIGTRILQDYNRCEQYGNNILQNIANSCSMSYEGITKCLQFARKFPTLDNLPLGKNANWGDVLKLLPDNSQPAKEKTYTCPLCGKKLSESQFNEVNEEWSQK